MPAITPEKSLSSPPLAIRVLGDFQILKGGTEQELPKSRKTRALLAYLVLTGRRHRQERLCELFWDVPEDPRGSLRWSLTRLRPVVDESGHERIVADRRYDARGNGLSDWDVEDISFDAFVRDLESVIEAAGVERFPLLGISQGCAISVEYAARHPDRVTHLVLHGGYASGWRVWGDVAETARREALLTLVLHGWGQDNPAFRQVFTSGFIPEGTPEQFRWMNELMRVSTSPQNAVRLLEAMSNVDIRHRLAQVHVPTLVIHSRNDGRVAYRRGLELAQGIPNARLVTLESNNHLILEHEPEFPRFMAAIRDFLKE